MKKLLMASLLAMLGAQALAECRRQALEIPVQIVNHRPVVTMRVEGTELRMLLDTGAFHSVLMPSTAQQLNLPLSRLPVGIELMGYAGRIEAKMTKVKEVNLHGLPYRNIEFIVGGNELGAGIQGILGRNFLRATDVEYDLGQGLMRLHAHSGNCEGVHPVYWTQHAPVIEAPLAGDRRLMVLTVTPALNGKHMEAMLDTGAPATTLTLGAARQAGVARESMALLGRTGGAGKGSVKVWLAPLERFELGGQTVGNIQIQVADVGRSEQDLLIGLDYFLSHRIYVSRVKNTLYATWNGGPVFSTGALARDGDAQAGALHAELPEGDPDALARMAAASSTRGDPARALTLLDRAVAMDPQNAEHRLARARVHLALKQAEPAMADVDEALRLAPQLLPARLLRAQMLAAARQQQELALELAALDRDLDPAAHERLALGQLHASQGQLPEALKQWALWLPTREQDQRRGDLFNSRCWLRARLGLELDEALKDCEAAIRTDSRIEAYQDSLGWLQLRRGEARAARKAFDRALALNERLAYSRYGRALAQRRLGDHEAAAQDLTAARALQPHIETLAAEAGFADLAR